jgi:alkylation response protein AidB-like acyl-CoA dehydrogenase
MLLTKQQKRWQDLARQFAQTEVKPRVDEMEKKGEFPLQFMKRLGELGILGIGFPEQYGGQNADSFSFILAVKEISKVWASLGLSIGAHLLGANPIYFAGTEEQKKRYLIPLVRGESLGAFGLTEPSSGSDAGSSQTSAVSENGVYALNGRKIFTTSASYASTYVVSALTIRAREKVGISAFILERNYPGLAIAKKEEKLGLWASDTAGLILEGCRVPKENLLGDEGKGFRVFLQTLNAGRLGIAGWALGIAEAAFEQMLEWAEKNEIKKDLMNNHEWEAGMIAESATKLEAALLLTQEACRVKDTGELYIKEASMAKYFVSSLAVETCDLALKLIGASALTNDLPVERYFRDAKLGEIGEGTSEIQKLVIAREVLRKSEKLVTV